MHLNIANKVKYSHAVSTLEKYDTDCKILSLSMLQQNQTSKILDIYYFTIANIYTIQICGLQGNYSFFALLAGVTWITCSTKPSGQYRWYWTIRGGAVGTKCAHSQMCSYAFTCDSPCNQDNNMMCGNSKLTHYIVYQSRLTYLLDQSRHTNLLLERQMGIGVDKYIP